MTALQVEIREGYLGLCARCLKRDATHSEWCAFTSEPIFTSLEGCWHNVCNECCDPEAKHREAS